MCLNVNLFEYCFTLLFICLQICILLFLRGADINWEGPDDKSPLHVAATAGNRAVTQLLLGYGANVRAKDNNLYVK